LFLGLVFHDSASSSAGSSRWSRPSIAELITRSTLFGANSGAGRFLARASRPDSYVTDFREFRNDDYGAVRALWEASEGIGLSAADSPARIRQFLARNPGLSFVAVQNGLTIGAILCGHDGRRGLIHHLVVADAERRRGVGRSLVQRSLAALRADGIDKCHLLVFRKNTEGHSFWGRIGAEERVSLGLFSMLTDVPS
jgi:GNAT superfamily N-acetyltransferase